MYRWVDAPAVRRPPHLTPIVVRPLARRRIIHVEDRGCGSDLRNVGRRTLLPSLLTPSSPSVAITDQSVGSFDAVGSSCFRISVRADNKSPITPARFSTGFRIKWVCRPHATPRSVAIPQHCKGAVRDVGDGIVRNKKTTTEPSLKILCWEMTDTPAAQAPEVEIATCSAGRRALDGWSDFDTYPDLPVCIDEHVRLKWVRGHVRHPHPPSFLGHDETRMHYKGTVCARQNNKTQNLQSNR